MKSILQQTGIKRISVYAITEALKLLTEICFIIIFFVLFPIVSVQN
jgi:nitrate reductase NapE component